jgi:hypothetical protein
MGDVTLFWCPQCNRCRRLAAHEIDERVRCGACDTFFPSGGHLFGRFCWKTTNDPDRVLAAARELDREPSMRKWRLLACAIGRTEYDWCRNPWFRDALDCAEKWADDGEPPRGTAECVEHFAHTSDWSRGSREARGWVSLSRRMLREDPRPRPDDLPQWRALSASLLRDLLPDPFGHVAWNSEWCTSTVRELAAHIYTAREFDAMPILADALQDADCNDKRILNHCRVEKLHARGCWLLDAILGKT